MGVAGDVLEFRLRQGALQLVARGCRGSRAQFATTGQPDAGSSPTLSLMSEHVTPLAANCLTVAPMSSHIK